MKRIGHQVFSYAVVIAMAILLAVNYHLFIVENHFAPAGLNGIATMIQFKTGFSISYMSLLINVPLCILAYFLVEKEYAVKSLVFSVVYAVSYLFLQQLPLDHLKYDAQDHNTIFPVIISGVISGMVSGVCLKNVASTGGTDILSKYINKVRPDFNFFVVTFVLNALVAGISLFVYADGSGADYEPVALCITYCCISTFVGNYIIRGTKTAYKFTVITTHPDEIIEEVTHKLRHSVTRLSGQGGYTHAEKTVLLCVVNKHQLIDFKKIIDQYDDTFSFYELANETYGNFKHVRA